MTPGTPHAADAMHVLHVTNSIGAGGSELHLLTLCRHLHARGVSQTVLTLHERPPSRSLKPAFEEAGIQILSAGAHGRYNVTFPLTVLRIVGRVRPHILHTHLPRADLAGGFVKLRHRELPWVVSMHNIYGPHSWSGAALLPVLDVIWRRSDRIIAISAAVKAWLTGRRGIAADRIRVIHYGINPEPFFVPHPEAKARWGVPGRPLVTAIGRLTPHKGFATLISAWGRVHERYPEAVLAIAGWDIRGYAQKLQALISSLGLRDVVHLVGFVDDIAAFLAAGDLFVHPSTSEGFGQVVIEAMAAARPVVASRIAPLTEIVEEGETGLLVPPEDPEALAGAVMRVLSDSRSPAMGARGRQRVVEHFSAARMAEQTLAVYDGLRGGA